MFFVYPDLAGCLYSEFGDVCGGDDGTLRRGYDMQLVERPRG